VRFLHHRNAYAANPSHRRQHRGQPATGPQSGAGCASRWVGTSGEKQAGLQFDETSWRQVGAAKHPWLWTVVTARMTLFRIAPSRSSQVARELLGETYNGVAGTDRCSADTWLKQRQYCWSHLLHDFQKILERGDDSYPIGWYLKVQAEYLLMRWARVRDGTLAYFEFLAEFPAIQTHTRHWLTLGLTVSSARTATTCRRLLAADPDLWRFVSVPSLEPTNNSAERALRHPVIWRRNSHGTQSDGGSRFVERILPWLKPVASSSVLSLTLCGMLSLLIGPVIPPLRSYPLPNLETIPNLPPERIRDRM
jgi:hypothetical protein